MKILLTLLSTSPNLELPQGLIGWAGWLIFLALITALLRSSGKYNKSLGNREKAVFFLLLLAVPLTTLLLGIRLPVWGALPRPELPDDPTGPALMLFSALPWVLAGGLFGPAPAALLAAFSGLLLAIWDTHHLFTPLELAFLAVVFSIAANQRYRTFFFRLVRHPLIVSLLLSGVYALIFFFITPLTAGGILASRLDYTLTRLGSAVLAVGGALLVAGLAAEVIAVLLPNIWGRTEPLEPSPAQRSLQFRILQTLLSIGFVLVLVLMVSDWLVAGEAATNMLQNQMRNAAETAAQSVPYYMESGHNLIVQISRNPDLLDTDRDALSDLLAEELRTVPFFRQLYYLNERGELLAGYPRSTYQDGQAPPDEQMGIQLALTGIPVQSYTLPPVEGEPAAQVTFLATVFDSGGAVRGIILGRSDLASNPFTQPVLNSLNSLAGVDGQGILIDEYQRILYHPNPALVMTNYTGQTSSEPAFFTDTAPDGTRRLVFVQPALGHPWSVVLTVPASRAQQQALDIAAPLLFTLVILVLFALVFSVWGLRSMTASMRSLAQEAVRISQGQLDRPVKVNGEDEFGQLRGAFEKMRIGLKARLDELNRLLEVSQGVASSLEFEEAVKPVLESALATGAAAARIVLEPSMMPDLEDTSTTPLSFGLGPAKDIFKDLDEHVLALTRQQDRVVLSNPSRPRSLKIGAGFTRPASLLAVALRHENRYYGCLWIVFDRYHTFTEEEARFLATLAGQAALAAANTRLFLTAEIGRQRLAAILASTPDPVLVTDQNDRLLLANPAAWQVLGLGMENDEGRPIDQVIQDKELVALLRSSGAEKQSVEVRLPDGQVYLATASSVLAEGQRVGRVCVMRDVTRLKELDELKSEFVSTVSHDLRSPLTLMRGYATMLEMVGDLNDQQTDYVRKIITGVESMSRLVNNLLDLRRIEAGIGLQLEMVPTYDLLERVVNTLQIQAQQKHIQISIEQSPENKPLIEADQALLQQALHNLVDNAIKYTRPDGKVKVRIHQEQDRVVYQIMDTGIGISPMDQPRLFEKFYRGAQQGSKDQRGSGLGLAIVKSIADLHHGEVWVESQLGKGSMFSLAIPIRQRMAQR